MVVSRAPHRMQVFMSKTRSNMTDDDPQHGHSFDAGSGTGQVAIAYLASKFSSRSPSVTVRSSYERPAWAGKP